MNAARRTAPQQAAALCLAAFVTLALLAGVNGLARSEAGTAPWAQAQAAAAPQA